MVEGLGEVRADSKKVALEIRDLDPIITEQEIKAELIKALWNKPINQDVQVLNSNQRGLKLAVVVQRRKPLSLKNYPS